VPKLITFEGIEGSGKSTHARLLGDHLRTLGWDPLVTHEPGGTPLGEPIRRLVLEVGSTPITPLAELLLYCADRAQHVDQVIRPALAAGRPVVCDRFSDSTIAYQGHGRGLDLEVVRTIEDHARDGLTAELTFVFDCPATEGLARARRRAIAADRIEGAPLAFHERVRQGFLALAALRPERYCVLDSTGTIDDIQRQVRLRVLERLGAR
jgi:dTMP kinase